MNHTNFAGEKWLIISVEQLFSFDDWGDRIRCSNGTDLRKSPIWSAVKDSPESASLVYIVSENEDGRADEKRLLWRGRKMK